MKTLATLGAALALAAALPATAATVLPTPVSTQLLSGTSFELVLRGENFAQNVIGGGLNLAWDPAVLDLVSVTVDTTTWSFASSPGVLDAAAGTLTDLYFASFAAVLPTGSFPIATLRFAGDGPGSTAIQLSASATQPFASDQAQLIAVDFVHAQVVVSAVPEPASWAMFVLAAALLPVLRRRSR
jgi:hypothetical protein